MSAQSHYNQNASATYFVLQLKHTMNKPADYRRTTSYIPFRHFNSITYPIDDPINCLNTRQTEKNVLYKTVAASKEISTKYSLRMGGVV